MSRPGEVAADATVGDGWLLNALGGRVVLLALGQTVDIVPNADLLTNRVTPEIRSRYLGNADAARYLVRPDHVIAARCSAFNPDAVAHAVVDIWEGRI